MQYQITSKKDFRGTWSAKTYIPLADNRRLIINSWKDYNKRLVTMASVVVFKNEGAFTSESFEMFGDYNRKVRISTPKVVNEKRVREQQEAVLKEELDGIIAEAKEFYQAKGIQV